MAAAGPAVGGWLLHVMPDSVQPPASRSASIVRPVRAEPAYRRRVADSTKQPEGAAGCAKRTAARRLFTGPLDITLSTESLPLLSDVEAWSNQASAAAVRTCGSPQSAARPSIVQVRLAGESSTLPAMSVARTSKRCSPSPRPNTVRGDAHAANAEPSSEHANVDPGSLEENSNVAEPSSVVPAGPASIEVSGAVASGVVGPAGAKTSSSWIDHQLPAVPVCTIRRWRAVETGSGTAVVWPVPDPVARVVHVAASFDTSTR